MRIASRFKEGYKKDKCPYCLEGWSDFILPFEREDVLACYKCGSIFLSKEARVSELARKKEQFEIQQKEQVEVPAIESDEVKSLKCSVCEFEAKSKAGLMAHMRRHNEI